MKLITVSGPPSSGKTSVLIKTLQLLKQNGYRVGVVKFDCLLTHDHIVYRDAGIEIQVGLSGNLCPDHFFISNIEETLEWGKRHRFDFLVTESAGLCNRCSPYIRGVQAVCIIDNLMGINTPKKIGPMLKLADLVVITKGDIVSQAEREVFAFKVRQTNPKAYIMQVNGVTGQGAAELGELFLQSDDVDSVEGSKLRFAMPMAMCSYCLGETQIGDDFQMGNVRKMKFD